MADFFSLLLEDWADEYLWRPAMYYRWKIPKTINSVQYVCLFKEYSLSIVPPCFYFSHSICFNPHLLIFGLPITYDLLLNLLYLCRWEPNFDSGQLSQRFSWEFLDGATPFQLLNPLLAPLDACIPKSISIELVTTMPENVLKTIGVIGAASPVAL